MRKSQVLLAKERNALLEIVKRYIPDYESVNVEYSTWWHRQHTVPNVSRNLYVFIPQRLAHHEDDKLLAIRSGYGDTFKQFCQRVEVRLREVVKCRSN